MVKLRLVLFWLLSVPAFGQAANPQTIAVLTYHNHPPFIISAEQKTGLTYDLVALLNQKAAGKYLFKVRILPRKRLDLQLNLADPWVVVWVDSKWFGDPQEQKYNWLKILKDQNSIVSHRDKKVVYTDFASLEGLRLGGIAGHRYVGIDELVKKGKIRRFDGEHEEDNLRILLAKRVDAILLPYSTITYFVKMHGLENKVFIAPRAHQTYYRKFMLSKKHPALFEFLQQVNLAQETRWLGIITRYGLN